MLDTDLEACIRQIHESGRRLVLELAGGGSLALAWLHAVPGSSRTVLEAGDRYCDASLTDLLGAPPSQAVSSETARGMAERAYRRAGRLAAAGADILGIACTAAMVTDRKRRGANRAWIVVHGARTVVTYGLEMVKDARDRLGEETLVSRLLLAAIAEAVGVSPPAIALLEGEQVHVDESSTSDPLADLLAEKVLSVLVHPDGRMVVDPPPPGALLSGAFNPFHTGHERLAHAAAVALDRTVVFELPVANADKPTLTYAEAAARLAQFRERYPLLLSRAALFVDKAELYPGCVFVIGYDTATRLVEGRYYRGTGGRRAALERIRLRGCRFLVAGRVDQGAFRTLADVRMPGGFEDLFVELPEGVFREDLSSTEIRSEVEEAESAPAAHSPQVGEPVAVETRMEADGTLQPLAFEWHSRRWPVASLGRCWQEAGEEHFLAMTAGEQVFELIYSPTRCAWRLRRRSARGQIA